MINISCDDFVSLLTTARTLLGAGALQESDSGSGLAGLIKMVHVFSRGCAMLVLVPSSQAEWLGTGRRLRM